MANRNSLFKMIVLVLFLVSLSYEVYGDRFLINCGSTENTNIGDRVFLSDTYMRNFLTTPIDILAKNPVSKNMGIYQTARVFKNKTGYYFPINLTGRYFIRLFFFPFTYGKCDMSTASFNVSIQEYELLGNFRPSRSPTVKEFSINATSTFLEIVLEPTQHSIAFLNALEVVLIPDALIRDDAMLISPRESFRGLIKKTFETCYHVNMGGPIIDSDNLGRTWISDDIFLENKKFAVDVRSTKVVRYAGLATRNDAPPIVYGSCRRLNHNVDSDVGFNVTWKFDVDPGFQYYLRFHFCDIVSADLDELYFNVYVNSWIVSSSLDLTSLSRGNLAVPLYLDYITQVAPGDKLSISIGPDTENPNQRDGILNGLEIMKISRSDTLSRAPPLLLQMGHPPLSQKGTKNKIGMILGPIAGVFFLFFPTSIALIILYKGKNKRLTQGQRQSQTSMGSTGDTTGPATLITRLSLAAIQEATNGFDGNLIIGDGGFGKVYKGFLGSNGTEVAVKRCIQSQSSSGQGRNEFENEIQLLLQLQHPHLISLVGNCDEQNELILVYRYMENESLKSHLYGKGKPILSWNKRLEICIGAAKGLKYLHHEKEIIHRDVKSGNILLDENFDAKLADFGLSRPFPRTDHLDISTVKGTAGYIDPDYFMDKCVLSSKVDVYSFGVVLFEVLCARPVVDNSLPENERNLVQWAKSKLGANELQLIIDNNLDRTTINPESLCVYVETAQEYFLRHTLRPSMEELLIRLDRVLQAQLQADASNRILVSENDSNTGATTSDIEDIKAQTPSTVFYQMRLRTTSQETGNSSKASG